MFSKLIVDSDELIAEPTRAAVAPVVCGRALPASLSTHNYQRSTPNDPLSTHNYPLSTSRAFTLIEILVVLGIITLIAALGVPIYNALSGARSVEAAQNSVSAYLGMARTIAINEGKSAGVMFYVDPATERTAMAIVLIGDTSLEDPDPYEKYKGWFSTASYTTGDLDPNNDGNTSDRTRADRVIGFTSDGDSGFDGSSYRDNTYVQAPANRYVDARRYIGNFRPAVKVWRAERDSTGSSPVRFGSNTNAFFAQTINTSTPINTAVQSYNRSAGSIVANKYANNNWTISTGKIISQYGNSEQQLLPKGIGVQVIIQPTSQTAGGYQERYVRTGIILFDPQGRLVLRVLKLPKTTTLGEYIELGVDAEQILSGVGVALYNQTAFKNLTTPNGPASEMDWIYLNVPGNTYRISSGAAPFNDYPSAAFADESAEEDWLANNTVPVLINRFSGSLSESE